MLCTFQLIISNVFLCNFVCNCAGRMVSLNKVVYHHNLHHLFILESTVSNLTVCSESKLDNILTDLHCFTIIMFQCFKLI